MGMICLRKDKDSDKFIIEKWMDNKTSPPKTWAELARAIGISESLLEKIKMGLRQITTNVQAKLCDITGYDVGDICTYDRTREPKEQD
jgi:DNA-binding Xre family transcriptional regulator